ncbi:hypothetical protein V493_03466 [Pseudogymnoascus sp. VKM F-4281 (FW-2241)]|nr:hypothetical protein V493_03466 [Pseudogymnoascus sp. VKM F-4281 (FW-2241)]
MAGSKVLVLGGTGPAGICLLRELLYRNHSVVVFARTPSKIPEDLASSPLLEIIQGALTDLDALSTAVSASHTILSLLGPAITRKVDPTAYSSFYTSLFALMRQHSVRRIFAMGTISIPQPADKFSLARLFIVFIVRLLANTPYRAVLNIGRAFEEAGEEVDWTVFRIAGIPGGSNEEAWMKDREEGEVFEGWVGEKGWSAMQKRGALARWLVDAAEDGKERWVGKMPAVARLKGSKRKAD